MMAAMYTSYSVVNSTYSQVSDRAKISSAGRDGSLLLVLSTYYGVVCYDGDTFDFLAGGRHAMASQRLAIQVDAGQQPGCVPMVSQHLAVRQHQFVQAIKFIITVTEAGPALMFGFQQTEFVVLECQRPVAIISSSAATSSAATSSAASNIAVPKWIV